MKTQTRKPSFRSTVECLDAARELMTRLERRSHGEAAAALRSGFACLNGLTDGWALFLASIEKVQAVSADRLDPEDRRALEALQEAAQAAVHRR